MSDPTHRPPPPGRGHRVAVRPGVSLYYEDHGGAGDPVVLLHGGGPGSSGANFAHNVASLAAHFRVVNVDLPGFGRSTVTTPIDDEVGPAMADLVAALLTAIGVPSAHLVGNSMGAAVACFLALRHPHFVRRLALIGPGGIDDGILSPLPSEFRQDAVDYYASGDPTPARMRHLLERLVVDRTLITDDLVDERYRASVTDDVLASRRQFRSPTFGDLGPHLGRIAHPSLVVWGLEDRALPLDVPLTFAKRLPDGLLVAIPRAGHWVMWERAPLVDRLVSDFLLGRYPMR